MVFSDSFSYFMIAFPIIVLAILVIGLRNPIHSVIALMGIFCSATIFLIYLGLDFIAFIFLMVYVGAIAVLFLFVVMMLNIKILEWNQYLYTYLPIGSVIGFLLFYILRSFYFSFNCISTAISTTLVKNVNLTSTLFELDNIERLGSILYTEHSLVLIFSGFVLLVAMLGAIVLTLSKRYNVKRQSIIMQMRKTAIIQNINTYL
jgi:NADH-quinone oxidoreductase subunit J